MAWFVIYQSDFLTPSLFVLDFPWVEISLPNTWERQKETIVSSLESPYVKDMRLMSDFPYFIGNLVQEMAFWNASYSRCFRTTKQMLLWEGWRRIYFYIMTENMRSILRRWQQQLFPEEIKKKYNIIERQVILFAYYWHVLSLKMGFRTLVKSSPTSPFTGSITS